jgi:putative transposase
MPAHDLTEEARARILNVVKEPRFADQPPARIVPTLADDGVHIVNRPGF